MFKRSQDVRSKLNYKEKRLYDKSTKMTSSSSEEELRESATEVTHHFLETIFVGMDESTSFSDFHENMNDNPLARAVLMTYQENLGVPTLFAFIKAVHKTEIDLWDAAKLLVEFSAQKEMFSDFINSITGSGD